MAILEINTNLLNELYKHNILLSYNSPPPNENGYGWLKIGQQIEVKNSLIVEENWIVPANPCG